MINIMYAFLSNDFSGLAIALVVLLIAFLGFKLSRSWVGRVAFGIVGIVAFGLAIGATTHVIRVASIDERFPAPGVMVDVGGYELHVFTEGPKDGPAVVWFGGGHAAGYSMYHLHEAIKAEARSILIDRPGTGWSDAGPFPRTTAREADEMIMVLENAGEKPPFVLAGHSFGGLLAINVARRYPERTAALALLDATPLDVIFYGLDREGLGKLRKMSLASGLRHLFGFYKTPSVNPTIPQTALGVLQTRSRNSFAGSSIYEELTAKGMIDRAFDTMVFDGELGDMPLYLIAPQGDAETQPYTETVTGGHGPRARRFEAFLNAVRERYLAASSNSTRVIAPEGTGHNFPYQAPDFVIETIRGILKEVKQSYDKTDRVVD